MSKRDYYEVLGVGKSASAGEIKAAYRKAAVKYHPDRAPGCKESEEKFKEAAEAYEVLSDQRKRQQYDHFGHQAVGSGGFADVSDVFASFGSIFEDFFGMSGGVAKGENIRYDLELEFKEAIFGVAKDITYQKSVQCHHCHGTGARSKSDIVTCPKCGGSGYVRVSQGFFTVQTTCDRCDGRGVIVKYPCEYCGGSGALSVDQELEVKVPPGVESGMKLRIAQKGEDSPQGGRLGDLYVVIQIKPSDTFIRDGDHIILPLPISIATAALGGTVEVESLHGKKNVKIPPGTQFGHKIHFPALGVPFLRGSGRGDFIVLIQVMVPESLNKKQRDLLEQFSKTLPDEDGSSGSSSSGSGIIGRLFH